MMAKITIYACFIFILTGCNLKKPDAPFEVGIDRQSINTKANYSKSGKVLLYLKKDELTNNYQRLDFNY
ncbi:hypothetical protein JCM30760_22130 [Thiomicrorhabdus hydrogeniphila]